MTQPREQVVRQDDSNVSDTLLRAVREGELERAKELINSYGLSYSKEWSEGYVLLLNAIQNKHLEVARFLIQKGSRVNIAITSEGPFNTYSPLHWAVIHGYKDIVRILLENGANVEDVIKFELSPLYTAIRCKKIEIAILLLKYGVDVKPKESYDVSPIHVAVDTQSLQIVEYILKCGADVDRVCLKNGYTALHYAARKGNKEITLFLLSKGANVDLKAKNDMTPLHVAVDNGHIDIADELLKRGARINSTTLVEGYFPIHLSSKQQNDGVVKLLLNKGADVNARTRSNLAPLHIATKTKNRNVVQLLLQHGANVDIQDNTGKTVLTYAVEAGCSRIVKTILEYGPDINIASNRRSLITAILGYGFDYKTIFEDLVNYGIVCIDPENANNITLLHCAIGKGSLKIVEQLFNFGADIYAVDENGITALHITAHNKLYYNSDDYSGLKKENDYKMGEIANFLLGKGATVNSQTKSGETTLHYASKNGYVNVVKVLLKYNANVNSKNSRGWVPLHMSIERGTREIIMMLLEKDANVNATTAEGDTPMHIAIRCKSEYAQQRRCILQRRSHKHRWDVTEALLKFGADINLRDASGRTALHIASEAGLLKDVEVLLKYNSDLNALCKNKSTELNLTDCNKAYSKTDRDFTGQTTSRQAKKNRYEKKREFLSDNAYVNSKDDKGWTPLHVSIKRGNRDIIMTLLENGANVNAKTADGETPLHIAIQCHKKHAPIRDIHEIYVRVHNTRHSFFSSVTKALLKFGADTDLRDASGNTALHIATKEGILDDIELLLQYGSDINITSGNNLTPLDLALYNSTRSIGFKCKVIVEVLSRHVVKMKAANLYVSTKNLELAAANGSNKISDFQKECEDEIEIIKIETIDNTNVTFYDMLSKVTSSLIMNTMRNDKVVQILNSDCYEIKFPLYTNTINSSFRKALERKKNLEHCNEIFQYLFYSLPELPHHCVEHIFSYLSNQELKYFLIFK